MERTSFREKYELEVVPMAIGEKKLQLYCVSNWDVFVNKLAQEGEEYIKNFPFWVRIWEASMALTDHLIHIGLGKKEEILEMGAGMGIPGLFLGAFGHRVTVTDYEEDALELLRMNVKHNRLHNVSVKKVDWNNPNLSGKYDVICGSELVYNEGSIKPLIDLFQEYLRAKGTVYLAHDLTRMCIVKFIGMFPGRFEIQNVVKTITGEDESHKVVIHSIRLK